MNRVPRGAQFSILNSQFSILKALVTRPISREKTRSFLTVLGIAVGVAVVVAIQLANQSALRAFRESIDAIAGRANYQIVPDAAPLDENVLLRLQPLWRDGVRFAPVIDAEGVVEPSQLPVRLLAVDLMSDLHFRDYRYAKIDVNRFLSLFRSDSIVVPAPFAKEQHLAVGSPLTLNILGRKRTLIVRGILEASGPATAFNGGIVICDISVAQRSFSMAGQLSRIDLLVPDEKLLTKIHLPPGVRMERPSRRNERVEKMLRAFRVNLFALAGVALLVGMFLVYNTVLISILRRRRDVGVLKTLGTSPRQIFFAFCGEGLIFGLAGSALGILLGYALASGILTAVGRTINTLYVASRPESVVLTPAVIATGIAVGTLLSLLSALQPSLEAARVRPSTMIRPGLQQPVRNSRALAIASAICFVLAAITSRIPPVGGIAVAGYVAVLLVVAAFSLLAPMIVTFIARIFAPLLQSAFGIVGKLAATSLPASLRRTSVASAALSLATGMMVAIALMVGSFRETVRIWVDQTVSSDLWLRPAKGLTNAPGAVFRPEVADELEKLPFIADVDRVRARTIVYHDAFVSVTAAEFNAGRDIPMITPRKARPALEDALRRNGVFVSESFSIKYNTRVGDVLELPARHGILRAPVSGIYRDYSNDRGVIVMDRKLYVRAYADTAINTIVVYLKPGITIDAARRKLERDFGPKHGAFVVTNGEVKKQVMTIFDQTFMITYALLGVAIIVAVLGIVNTLSALILERTRELALLRVTGLSSHELRQMIVLESSLLGVTSTAVGLVMGYVLSWILIYVINKQSFGWTISFHTPVSLIAASLSVTFVASVLAGLVPARLANRIALAAALKIEN
ncbi:MAG TPA: FtsX-like permease family protein [Thermoanaerobaculia bacterium]|nr:FtsX-like permease family protein [Thermoanaerobaculia bacterium]